MGKLLLWLRIYVLDVPRSNIGHVEQKPSGFNLLPSHIELSILGNEPGCSPVHYPLELVVHGVVFLLLSRDGLRCLCLLLCLGGQQLLLQLRDSLLLLGQLGFVALLAVTGI